MKKKNAYLLGCIFAVISLIFSALTMVVDVTHYGATDTDIGFSKINIGFHELTGVNIIWYDITDWLGIASIGVGLMFALVGLCQLIKRKSFAEVDKSIYGLGGVYVILGILYVGFEKIALNLRPIIMEGETAAEASFPSSHTLLICTIIATAIIQFNRMVDNKLLQKLSVILGSLFIIISIFGRAYSGVHWLTDIIASLLISTSLVFIFVGFSSDSKGKHSL